MEWVDRHVTKIIEPTGRDEEFSYNANGYLTQHKNQLDETTVLDYQNVAADANDVTGKWKTGRGIPHFSQLSKKTAPKGVATASPTTDFQWTFSYDTPGNLRFATDPDNNTTEHQYNADGTLAKTIDARQNATEYDYDANGMVDQVTDAKGEVTRMTYDDDGLLVSAQDAMHVGDTGDSREFQTKHYYDSFHRLGLTSTPKSTRFARGALVWSGSRYDANDNVTDAIAPHYAMLEKSTVGPVTSLQYDYMDRPTLVTEPDTSVDPAGERTKLDYDTAGRVIKKTDPRGMLTSGVADDHTETYVHDDLDRLKTTTQRLVDAAGTTLETFNTHQCFDLAGDLVAVIPPTANQTSPTCASLPNTTTKFEYDWAHRRTVVEDAEANRTTVEYDANGNAKKRTDAEGAVTTTEFDQRDLPIKVQEEFDKGVTPARLVTTVVDYDELGNPEKVISPRAWDAAPDKNAITHLVTSFTYDKLGRLIQTKLPKAADETEQWYQQQDYDAAGRLAWTALPHQNDRTAVPPALAPASARTNLDYWDTGWIRTNQVGPDPAPRKFVFDYTAEGWQKTRTPLDETGTARRVLEWDYFVDGQLRERRGDLGRKATYSYDANDNLIGGLDSFRTTGTDGIEMRAAYDGLDRLVASRQRKSTDPITGPWTTTRFALFDKNSNVKTRYDGTVEDFNPSNGTFTQQSNKPGRLHEFIYDRADRLAQHDDRGDASSAGTLADDMRTTTVFSATGHEELRTILGSNGSGVFSARQTTEWTYFANGLLKTLRTKNGGGTIIESHDVGYEQTVGGSPVFVNGHRVRDDYKLVGPTSGPPCSASTCTATYDYDGRDRLKQENDGHGRLVDYKLDGAGNVREEKVNNTAPLERSAVYENGLLKSQTTSQGTQFFNYDVDGNLDCIVSSDVECPAWGSGTPPASALLADYAYDDFDRLLAFDRFNAGTTVDSADYEYDVLDRPVKQVESHLGDYSGATKTTDFAYVGLSSEVSKDAFAVAGGASGTRTYSYDGLGHRTAMTDSEGTFTYGHDVHGSVSQLIRANGSVKAAYRYEGYGRSDIQLTQGDVSGTDPINPYRYSAKRWDSGSGSIDMGARRFGPDMTSFFQQDRFTGALADLGLSIDPLSQNRYALAGGNPVSFVEWDGHMTIPDGKGGASEAAMPISQPTAYDLMRPYAVGELAPLARSTPASGGRVSSRNPTHTQGSRSSSQFRHMMRCGELMCLFSGDAGTGTEGEQKGKEGRTRRTSTDTGPPIPVPPLVPDLRRDDERITLWHYTDTPGYYGLTGDKEYEPSTMPGPHARDGFGMYLTDLDPETAAQGSQADMSQALFGSRKAQHKVEYFLEISLRRRDAQRVRNVYPTESYGDDYGVYLRRATQPFAIEVVRSGTISYAYP